MPANRLWSLRLWFRRRGAWVGRFRARHLDYAARYIFDQAETSPANPTTVGTGSTPFMLYLKAHRDETWEHLIR
jgi:indoleamine 2,3-dioxygenase